MTTCRTRCITTQPRGYRHRWSGYSEWIVLRWRGFASVVYYTYCMYKVHSAHKGQALGVFLCATAVQVHFYSGCRSFISVRKCACRSEHGVARAATDDKDRLNFQISKVMFLKQTQFVINDTWYNQRGGCCELFSYPTVCIRDFLVGSHSFYITSLLRRFPWRHICVSPVVSATSIGMGVIKEILDNEGRNYALSAVEIKTRISDGSLNKVVSYASSHWASGLHFYHQYRCGTPVLVQCNPKGSLSRPHGL